MKKEDRYDSLFMFYGELYKIDWKLLKAQVKAESNFDPDAVSKAGAKGLAQFLKFTFEEHKDGKPGFSNLKYPMDNKLIDPRDPEDSILAQASFMSQLLNIYKGDITKALAAYNWGMGNLSKWMKVAGKRLPVETEEYIKRVLQFFKEYQEEIE